MKATDFPITLGETTIIKPISINTTTTFEIDDEITASEQDKSSVSSKDDEIHMLETDEESTYEEEEDKSSTDKSSEVESSSASSPVSAINAEKVFSAFFILFAILPQIMYELVFHHTMLNVYFFNHVVRISCLFATIVSLFSFVIINYEEYILSP